MIKLINESECTGCLACMNVCPMNAISLKDTSDGFQSPSIDHSKCISCGLCIKVCPEMGAPSKTEDRNPTLYAATNKDQNERKNSSSGGIFVLLAREVLKSGGIVFGAEYSDTFSVQHGWTSSPDELSRFQTSKYVQSNIGNCYAECKQFLEEGKMVLFSGTPCQISGLYSYLRQKYANLYTIDLICSGNTSPFIWNDYLNFMETKYDSKIKRINFRDKTYGWDHFSLSMEFESGKKYLRIFSNDSWASLFLHHLALRNCCYHCNYKSLNSQADFTLGDFWGVTLSYPEWSDDQGISFVLVHSETGKKLWNQIQEVNKQEIPVEMVIKHNKASIESASRPDNREVFFQDYHRLPFKNLLQKYAGIPLWRQSNGLYECLWKLRRMLGKCYHRIRDKFHLDRTN